jgi:hypothetical protein
MLAPPFMDNRMTSELGLMKPTTEPTHTDDWGGMEDVNGVHISKCWIINRVCQLNKVGRQH